MLIKLFSVCALVACNTVAARQNPKQQYFGPEPGFPLANQFEFKFTNSLGFNDPFEVGIQNGTTLTCRACQAIARAAKGAILKKMSMKAVLASVTELCILFKVQTPYICKEVIGQFGPWALTVAANTMFDEEILCGQLKFCPAFERPLLESPLPPRTRSPSPPQPIDPEGEKLYILHLSDWHFDPDYQEGFEADCGEPLCCRSPHNYGTDAKRPAGMWGDYNCDATRLVIDSMLETIPQVAPKLDFVVMTGDLPPHDIWAETQESVLEVEKTTLMDMKQAFDKMNISAYFSIGNHESAPINSFPTSSMSFNSIEWLYNSLAEQWDSWLSDKSLGELRKAGFYSVDRPQENLKIISINSNLGYRFNWWLHVRRNETDPDNMFQWLINELQESENIGEKVFIIGHMSPLDYIDGLDWFRREFLRIVTRYHDTIAGQFYGHTHYDEFQLFYEYGNSTIMPNNPINVAYIGPSVTPYEDVNPSFRVYEVDKNTKQVLNHFTYALDLVKVNEQKTPDWQLVYSAKEAYGLKDLSPSSWSGLVDRFEVNSQLFDQFFQYKSRRFLPLADSRHRVEPCSLNGKCRQKILCGLRGSKKCQSHETRADTIRLRVTYRNGFVNSSDMEISEDDIDVEVDGIESVVYRSIVELIGKDHDDSVPRAMCH
ncbi:sphingomyelin phosphodiesterase [Basidiobolus meristosporus CBS 931.73]|uniref:Sphingomyelin phosphodiesterase n=1 Tax=Basidiobolus meristosporus CBS 931.73 TaxID=1314790 RepID=A0A1Y1Y3D9_9FUNG|nr:sphingomyelin phosphodiesterase [Basidiobolus meristosporus CBS 931.73]|eukprot:ORX92527.1 sphingomyelin phosphodiesterase [Basidiobolus meristosporus CBS 931.73]